MKRGVILPAVVAVMSAAGCGGDDGPTALGTTARIRFFNATTGMTSSGAFTTNGQFATGSALAFGQATPTCAAVNAGSTSFGFGAANSAGTDLSGVVMATLNNRNITAGGNFTVATAGSPTNTTLFLLDNTFSGTLGSNQAAVRFVNLAPQSGTTTVNTFNVFKGTLGADGTPVALNIEVGVPTPFATVAIGASAYTILQGHETVIPPTEGTLSLQSGTANTIAIVPDPTSGGFRIVNIPACS